MSTTSDKSQPSTYEKKRFRFKTGSRIIKVDIQEPKNRGTGCHSETFKTNTVLPRLQYHIRQRSSMKKMNE